MSSPTATRMTAVLPKSARDALRLTLDLAAERGTIDAATALSLTGLMSDRQFAIDFKTKQAETITQQKLERAANKEARLQKAADKLGISLQEHKDNLQQEKESQKPASSASNSPLQSTPSSPISGPSPTPSSKKDKSDKKPITKKSGGGKKKKQTHVSDSDSD